MAVHFMDSTVFGGSVGTPEMRSVFEERSRFQYWLDTEAALAEAQASMGIIPKESAEQIRRRADAGLLDLDAVRDHGKVTGHSLVGLLKDFRRVVGGEDARYVHWGATTQDIIDTGQMLCVKAALEILERQMIGVMKRILSLMDEHAGTLMVGRTHGGHALPITLGLKMAIWLDEFCRQLERFRQTRERILVGNMTGAVGTFASWGSRGFELQEKTMKILGLGTPDTCWHSSRDRFAEVMALFGLIASTGARIGKEIYNLSKTEVSELEEPFSMGKVGSSTMPHKRNPVHCEWVIVLAKIIRSNAQLAMEAMVQENERDASAWKTEWIIIPESCVMMSSSLAHLDAVFNGLIVRKEQMKKNVDMLRGLLLSEPVMFVLAESMPLPQAHQKVYEASMRAFEKETSLLEELLVDDDVTGSCDRQRLIEALDAEGYTGLSVETVYRIKEKAAVIISDP
jgi:adenylosuccinate lyase